MNQILENVSDLVNGWDCSLGLMPYRMCLCVGYTQQHKCIEHETGEPYDCGESMEVVLLHCLACLTIYTICPSRYSLS